MTVGLRLRAPNGDVVFDTSDRAGRIIGTFTLTAGSQGWFTVPKEPLERIFLLGYSAGGANAQAYVFNDFIPGTGVAQTYDPYGDKIYYYQEGAGSTLVMYGVI